MTIWNRHKTLPAVPDAEIPGRIARVHDLKVEHDGQEIPLAELDEVFPEVPGRRARLRAARKAAGRGDLPNASPREQKLLLKRKRGLP